MQSKLPFTDFVIVTSDEPWGDIWHTQLHYAYQLSRRFSVIFLGPPSPWKLSHLWTFRQNCRVVSDNLEVINYVNLLPAFLGTFALQINDWLNSILIAKKLKLHSKVGALIIWHFDRYRSIRLFFRLKNVKHIYHVIDPVANLNGDLELSAKADLVVVTSPKFMDHYKKLNSTVIQLGQGIDLDFYSKQEESTNIESLISYNSVMLLGTLTDSIDYGMLESLVLKFPFTFCLIGPDKILLPARRKLFERLLTYPNVHWLGAMPPADFRSHLEACRVGIIAYDLSGKNNNELRSPLKAISYMASGKSVISNIDCETPSLNGKAVYFANNKMEFESLIERAFRGDLVFDKKTVDEFLKSINYDSLLEIIFRNLNTKLPEKII